MNFRIAGHEFARVMLDAGEASDAVIITDPGDNYATLDRIRRRAINSITLEFFDLDHPSDQYRTPTHQDVVEAIDWYDGLKKSFRWERGDTVVTCTAGISRSAALAFVLSCTDREPRAAAEVWNVRLHYPNLLIVQLGSEVLGKPDMIDVADEFTRERLRRRAAKGKPPKTD